MSTTSNRAKILKELSLKVKEAFAAAEIDAVHNFDHVQRVVNNTRAICQGEKIDSFLPEIAAWLHDIGRTEKGDSAQVAHAEASYRMAPAFLAPYEDELDQATIKEILEAVLRHSRKNEEDDSLLAMILKDADRLDGFGAIGIARDFAFLGEKPLWNFEEPFGGDQTSEVFLRFSGEATKLHGLYRNLEWFGWLRLKTARKLACPRVQFLLEFLYRLADDLGVKRQEVDKNPIVTSLKQELALIGLKIRTKNPGKSK